MTCQFDSVCGPIQAICRTCGNTGRAYRVALKLYENCTDCRIAQIEYEAFIKASEEEDKFRLQKRAEEIREQRQKNKEAQISRKSK
jgi:hypothetical protein